MSEFFVRNLFFKYGVKVGEIDLDLYERGEWDSEDLNIFTKNGKKVKVTIKSTKHFGNLMLLEKKDWNSQGCYIPSGESGKYDVFILVRLKFDLERKLKNQGIFYSGNLTKEKLKSEYDRLVANEEILFDLPGVLYKKDIIKVIQAKQIILKGNTLNQKTKMDADNYYIQTGNMREFEDLIKILRNY